MTRTQYHTLWKVIAWFVLVLVLFRATVVEMATIWWNNETFSHGFLILPISLWLLWRDRERLARLNPVGEPWALPLVLGGGLAWLLAWLVDVNVVQQLALVTVLLAGIWVLVGTPLARAMAFPLLFLFLAVPMGQGLIPPLMQFTADTTEYLVRAFGIPVYREGMYLTLPSGRWSVVEACSGVRYLIASFTLGLVYAWITYVSPWRRLLFVLAAIAVPILANSLRAWGIVMLGHYSGMKLAAGVDHLVYGWLFFGLVILLLFWLGSFWREDEPVLPARTPDQGVASPGRRQRALALPLLLALCALPGPVAAWWFAHAEPRVAGDLELPRAGDGWQPAGDAAWHWQPAQYGADRELQAYYLGAGSEFGGAPVRLELYQYLNQQPGMELVTPGQFWRRDRKAWLVLAQASPRTRAGDVVDEAVLASNDDSQRLLVWSWYWLDGRTTVNPYGVKLLEARQMLRQGHREGTRIYLSTPLTGERAAARARLDAFLAAHRPAIEHSLEQR